MAAITNYFEQAQLSLAAYALDLQSGMIGEAYPQYVPKLISAGMAEAQAKSFANTYTVLSQSAPNVNGFSATLFQDASGKKILAIRGTDDLFDALTDVVSIALLGTTAIQSQYYALENYYQQLITEGKLGASETFNVAGHSLGGFLAQSFAVDYAGKVSQAYTYNAPGIGGGVLSALGVTDTNIPLANITNIIAQPGLSVTAGLGTMLGNVQNVFIEQQINPLNNHRMGFLTDSLALYNLFAKVDPAVSLGTISSILTAATNTAANSLESALAAVGKIYGKTYSAIETSRNDLYVNLHDLQTAITGTGTVVAISGNVSSLAKTDIAYRYALTELNPFAITGDDALYTAHNASGELNLYDPATGSGNLTDLYLADRAAMLGWLNKANLDDTDVGRVYDGSDALYAGQVSTTNCLPQAARYRRIVATEGECLPDAKARSNRATAGACVPMRSATSACVKPASWRASSNKSSNANSSFSSRSYSLRTAGFFSILALNSSCFSMFNLLHAPHRGFQFHARCFLGFFDKPVQHHNPPSGQRAIHHTRNPFTRSSTQPAFTPTEFPASSRTPPHICAMSPPRAIAYRWPAKPASAKLRAV